jgi:integrase/recombinase XerD
MRKGTHPWRVGIPFAGWPLVDRATFQAAIQPKDLWDDGGGGQHWRPATVARYRSSWGRYLRFLEATGQFAPCAPMADRLRPEYIETYHTFLTEIGLAVRSIGGEFESLHNLLHNMDPLEDLAWLRQVLKRLQGLARACARPHPQLVGIDCLLAAALDAMRIADELPSARQMTGGARSELARSIDYRDALMVALLSVTLLRRRNLVELALGSSLLRQDGGYLIRLAPDQVKNGKPIEFEIYPRLVPFLDRYLDHHRPRLLQGRHSDRLWSNAFGEDLRPNRINQMVKRFTYARFGIGLNPHRFRTCAASSIAELEPNLVRIIQPLLAHWGPRTAEIYYNKARMIGASQKHARVIEMLRRDRRQHA